MKLAPLLLLLISFCSLADCRTQTTALDELACAIYFEAGNQGPEGMRLVGETILNRVASEDFPDSISDVVNQKRQYAHTKREVLYKAEYEKARHVAVKLMLLDLFKLRTGNVLWFHTVKLNPNCRFGEYILTYKDHVFCG